MSNYQNGARDGKAESIADVVAFIAGTIAGFDILDIEWNKAALLSMAEDIKSGLHEGERAVWDGDHELRDARSRVDGVGALMADGDA